MAIESNNEESREYGEWFLDSACSRHMTRDDSLFSSISKINGEKVIFGDNSKRKIIRVGNIGSKSSPSIEKVFLMNNLKHNLLSISQLYDKGYKIKFDHTCCLILENDKVLLVGNRK
jgi:hypothetical protein